MSRLDEQRSVAIPLLFILLAILLSPILYDLSQLL